MRGQYRFERQGLSIEAQKQEIQLRINQAEMRLRKLVKNTLQSTRGSKQASIDVIDAMSKNRAIQPKDVERAKQLKYAELFDTSVNKMYFSLLKNIILDNISVFTYVFEGYSEAIIRDNLSVINNSRRCPDHSYTEDAKNWSWEMFKEFRESMTWLEEILKDYD